MLDMMRRHSQSYIIYLFFGIIIVVFVFFFGPQSKGCGPGGSEIVAKVHDKDITSTQLERLFLRVSNWESRVPADQRLDPAIRRRFLAEDLILVQLLADQARTAGLAVSDNQLSAYVRDSQRNADLNEYRDRQGNFSMEQFELRVPGTFGLAIPEYEAWKEAELLAMEYLNLLAAAIPVSQGEVEALYRLRNTNYQLEYVRLDPDELAWLFAITADAVEDVLAEDPERVLAYFEEHPHAFSQERELRIRRILIHLGDEDDLDARAEARRQYETALSLVQENPGSFPEVAQEYSQAIEAADGGDMGWKTETAYASYPFLAERLSQLQLGEIETYESDRSLFIFRLEEEIPAITPAFEEVQHDVARAMLDEEQGDVPVRELAESFLARAREGLTLDEVVLEHARSLESTSVPTDEEVDLDDQPPSHVASEQPSSEEESQDIQSVVEVQETEPFALDTPGLDLSMFGPQYANQPRMPGDPEMIPGLGRMPQLARDLSQLSLDNPVAPQVYSDDQAFYAVRLAAYEPAVEPIPDETYEEIKSEIWREKTRILLGDWQARLLFHQARPLSPFLTEILDGALEQGIIQINEGYFAVQVADEPTS